MQHVAGGHTGDPQGRSLPRAPAQSLGSAAGPWQHGWERGSKTRARFGAGAAVQGSTGPVSGSVTAWQPLAGAGI